MRHMGAFCTKPGEKRMSSFIGERFFRWVILDQQRRANSPCMMHSPAEARSAFERNANKSHYGQQQSLSRGPASRQFRIERTPAVEVGVGSGVAVRTSGTAGLGTSTERLVNDGLDGARASTTFGAAAKAAIELLGIARELVG